MGQIKIDSKSIGRILVWSISLMLIAYVRHRGFGKYPVRGETIPLWIRYPLVG